MTHQTRRSLVIGGGTVLAVGAVAIATGGLGFLSGGIAEYAPARVFTSDGLAIRGYDPVAYFTQSQPVMGAPDITAEWRGAIWKFADIENRDAFLADPEAYAPQYGGFCAWAVAAKGKLYSTQPSNWTIHDGKLYLNFNDDIQRKWEADKRGFIAEGDRRWPALSTSS